MAHGGQVSWGVAIPVLDILACVINIQYEGQRTMPNTSNTVDVSQHDLTVANSCAMVALEWQ